MHPFPDEQCFPDAFLRDVDTRIVLQVVVRLPLRHLFDYRGLMLS